MTTWAEAIDALEERLRRQRAVVAGESAEPAPGELPVPSGECPPELVPTLQRLLAETEELAGVASEALGRMRTTMARNLKGASAYSSDEGSITQL